MVDPLPLLQNFNVLELIFSRLSFHDIANCCLVSKNWLDFFNDENSELWRLLCKKYLTVKDIQCKRLTQLKTYKSRVRGVYASWSLSDHSENIVIEPSRFLLWRKHCSLTTDGARSNVGFSSGKHLFDIVWHTNMGSSAIVGVSTKKAILQCYGYVDLLGVNANGWGWNLSNGRLLHNGSCLGLYPLCETNYTYQSGKRVRLVLDCDKHTLSFGRMSDEFGVAFADLPAEKLYVTITGVYAHSLVTLLYLGALI